MRDICYACFRPVSACMCARIPHIANRTHVVVLQHRRERFHPFGSAGMLVKALATARTQVVFGDGVKTICPPLDLPPDAGLLYPHPDAEQLNSLAPADRPSTLVLLDGTWSHANRLYKDNPWLQALPHYAIAATRPSRYLVRREPAAHCLSTLEAAVEALQQLEPGLADLDELLDVFEAMNVEQVARQQQATPSPRVRRRKRRSSRVIPVGLRDAARELVLVHAETAQVRADPGALGGSLEMTIRSAVFHCAALRVATGELFSVFVQPSAAEPTQKYLDRAGLLRRETTPRRSIAEFEREFSAFLRPGDALGIWNPGVVGLLPSGVTAGRDLLQLKAAYCNACGGPCGSLARVLEREELVAPQLAVPGRIGRRLSDMAAVAVFLVDFLQQCNH